MNMLVLADKERKGKERKGEGFLILKKEGEGQLKRGQVDGYW